MLDLITNRTQSDVDRARYLRNNYESLTAPEQLEYKNGPVIGEYRVTDLNRVGAAIVTLATLINSYGYTVTVNAKTDWTEADTAPRAAEMVTYLANIADVKAAFYGTQEIPSTMANISHADANHIELLLKEVDTYITNMIAGFHYCGTRSCGQGAIL